MENWVLNIYLIGFGIQFLIEWIKMLWHPYDLDIFKNENWWVWAGWGGLLFLSVFWPIVVVAIIIERIVGKD